MPSISVQSQWPAGFHNEVYGLVYESSLTHSRPSTASGHFSVLQMMLSSSIITMSLSSELQSDAKFHGPLPRYSLYLCYSLDCHTILTQPQKMKPLSCVSAKSLLPLLAPSYLVQSRISGPLCKSFSLPWIFILKSSTGSCLLVA